MSAHIPAYVLTASGIGECSIVARDRPPDDSARLRETLALILAAHGVAIQPVIQMGSALTWHKEETPSEDSWMVRLHAIAAEATEQGLGQLVERNEAPGYHQGNRAMRVARAFALAEGNRPERQNLIPVRPAQWLALDRYRGTPGKKIWDIWLGAVAIRKRRTKVRPCDIDAAASALGVTRPHRKKEVEAATLEKTQIGCTSLRQAWQLLGEVDLARQEPGHAYLRSAQGHAAFGRAVELWETEQVATHHLPPASTPAADNLVPVPNTSTSTSTSPADAHQPGPAATSNPSNGNAGEAGCAIASVGLTPASPTLTDAGDASGVNTSTASPTGAPPTPAPTVEIGNECQMVTSPAPLETRADPVEIGSGCQTNVTLFTPSPSSPAEAPDHQQIEQDGLVFDRDGKVIRVRKCVRAAALPVHIYERGFHCVDAKAWDSWWTREYPSDAEAKESFTFLSSVLHWWDESPAKPPTTKGILRELFWS